MQENPRDVATRGAPLSILVLSFWTPPLVRPQAILIGKMIPEWVRQGIAPVVVTYENEEKWDVDVPVHTLPQFVPPQGFFSHIPHSGFFMQILYYRAMVRRIEPLLKKYQINIVYSFANPQDSNIIGAILARKTSIPLVSHFCDPWYDNPYKKFSFLRKLKVLFWENYIVRSSKKVTITNESARRLIMKKFKKPHSEKGVVIPHCFSPSDYPDVLKHAGKFTLSYIGAFYQQRNPSLLFSVLQNVFQKSPELKKDFILQLVGTTNMYAGYSEDVLRKLLDEYGLLTSVEIIPPVDYKESLRYMKESDCLMVIDANFQQSPFLPSKIADYIGSGTLIVGITPKDSSTSHALNELGYRVFDYNEQQALTEYLIDFIGKRKLPSLNQVAINKYSVHTTTIQLLDVFKDVHQGKS